MSSVWCFFKSTRQVYKLPVFEFDKNCTQNAYFFQKVDFCIFEAKNCEVIENSSKTPLNGLVVIFQETARNHFWEAGMLMQSYMLETVQ